MLLRILLMLLCAQKAIEAVCACSPELINFVLAKIMSAAIAFDHLSLLLLRMWGGASLAWSYLLFRAFINPKQHKVTIDATIIGFLSVGLAMLLTPPLLSAPLPPYPIWLVRSVGIVLLLESMLLVATRFKADN